MTAAGLVLAAGAGRRFGGPKALVRDASGEPWVARACAVLRDGGCGDVVVVLGAQAEAARRLVPAWATPVVADAWAHGLAASLRAGLTAVGATEAEAVVVTLVDLPDLRPDAVARVLGAGPPAPSALRRALYDGRPGHPVLLGPAHWAPVAARATGDAGAGPYLREHGAQHVDCTDLGGGADVDARG